MSKRLFAAIMLIALCGIAVRTQDKSAFKPAVPLLELRKDANGVWKWFHGKAPQADDGAALVKQLSEHVNEPAGWAGYDANNVSRNPLVLLVDGHAPESDIGKLMERAVEVRLTRFAIGTTQHVEKTPDSARAPDLTKMGPGFLVGTLPHDEGLDGRPQLPKERVAVFCKQSDGGEIEYGTAIGGRVRRVIDGTRHKASQLVVEKTSTELVRKEGTSKRKALIGKIADAAAKLIVDSGVKVEALDIERPDGETLPWVALEIARLAADEVNRRRAEKKLTLLEITLPWERAVSVPPAPEQPPTPDTPAPRDSKDEPPPANHSVHPVFAARKARAGQENVKRIEAALDWLRDHQERDGSWTAARFKEATKRANARLTHNTEFVKPGDASGDTGWKDGADIGLTGLAIMAFAAGGETHKAGPYRDVLRNSVIYMKSLQDNTGCVGPRDEDHFVYNHAISTVALAELFALSGDQLLKPIVDAACRFILNAQNPGLGWRYGVQPNYNDSSVTGWMVVALQTAKWAGIELNLTKSLDDAMSWYDLVSVKVGGVWKTGYDAPGSNNARLRAASDYDNNAALDAIHGAVRHMTGRVQAASGKLETFARVVSGETPKWQNKSVDFYCWHWAATFLHQRDEKLWQAWKKACMPVLIDNQRGFKTSDKDAKLASAETLDEHGSWDSVDPWAAAGGRVYSTAMGVLILSTEWRYKRVSELPKNKPSKDRK